MKNLIVIAPYNPQWALEFQRLGTLLRSALGDLALRIDHIGSTAVPGLSAKDVIDMQITVATLDTRTLVAAISTLGYRFWDDITGDHLPPGRTDAPSEWSKLYFSAPAGQRRTNLHVRQAGRANQRYALLFRDYLRADQRTGADGRRQNVQQAGILDRIAMQIQHKEAAIQAVHRARADLDDHQHDNQAKD